MTRKPAPRKIIDESSEVRCASGAGIIREEVWTSETGAIVRYNLAFINPALTPRTTVAFLATTTATATIIATSKELPPKSNHRTT